MSNRDWTILFGTITGCLLFIMITAITYDVGKSNVYKDLENHGCEKMIKLHNEKKA